MNIFLLCWLCLSVLPDQAAPAASPAPSYSTSYTIFIRGARMGTESVSEGLDASGNRVAKSQHDMLVSDGLETKRMVFETTMVFAGQTTVPLSYSYRYTSGLTKDFCEVTVKGGKINRVLSRAGNISEASAALQPATVIIDFNVFHLYDVLPRMYDFKKGGRQLFSNFLPVIGNELPLAVTWLEDSRLEYANGSIPVRNYKVEFVGVRAGVFSTDMSGRLVRLVMREQDLEVVRTDLVPEK
jgi:hypothetical protein